MGFFDRITGFLSTQFGRVSSFVKGIFGKKENINQNDIPIEDQLTSDEEGYVSAEQRITNYRAERLRILKEQYLNSSDDRQKLYLEIWMMPGKEPFIKKSELTYLNLFDAEKQDIGNNVVVETETSTISEFEVHRLKFYSRDGQEFVNVERTSAVQQHIDSKYGLKELFSEKTIYSERPFNFKNPYTEYDAEI